MHVIFNGDDFGLTTGINQGVIRSFKQGLLSSASLVPGAEAGQEAIRLAMDHTELDIGVHLVLSDEPPLLPRSRLTSILRSTRSFPSRNQILRSVVSGKIDYSEVEAEWCEQVEKVLKAGIQVSHLDSHQFVHLFPGLMRICFRIARRYTIPFVRVSSDDALSLSAGVKRVMQWSGLGLWTHVVVSRSVPPPIRGIPSVGFLHAGGRMTRDRLLNTLNRLRSKKTPPSVEVMLHPGIDDTHTRAKYRHWGYAWQNDLALLTDPSFKNDLIRQGIIPASFRQIL